MSVGTLAAEDIEGLDPEQKRSLLIQRAADRLAERYRFPIEGRSLEERVAAAHRACCTSSAASPSGARSDDGFEIRDYNCVFARL